MGEANYVCPHCGAMLTAYIGDPNTPPWQCAECHHGWWMNELQPTVSHKWRPEFHDFGYDVDAFQLRNLVNQERAQAQTRRTSFVEEHVGRTPTQLFELEAERLQEDADVDAETFERIRGLSIP